MIAICIPCFEPRFNDLVECIETMHHDDFIFIVITNEPNPVTPDMVRMAFPDPWSKRILLKNTNSTEINLSKWWNAGLRVARDVGAATFMVTESDVRLRPDMVRIMQSELRRRDLAMVGPNLYGTMREGEISAETRQDSWGHRHPGHRICQTWMVDTYGTLEADERFPWWIADEQHEMRHRAFRNGTALIGSAVYDRPLQQDTDWEADEQRRLGTINARRIFEEEWGFPTLA